ncbi:CxxxxCH/CxxCH domain-containing protein [Pseudomonas helleri]|uniref:CxxxxCH/CxxCH domain-containing protein n=1 Tax=Pseudomonas helleri TaxID=1608996 RepID=UPI0038095563
MLSRSCSNVSCHEQGAKDAPACLQLFCRLACLHGQSQLVSMCCSIKFEVQLGAHSNDTVAFVFS